MIKYLLLISVFSTLAFADHEPKSTIYTSRGISLRFFKKLKDQKVMLNIENAETYDKKSSQIKLGSYYKLGEGQQLGYFLSTNTGLRHTDDWIKINSKPQWKWKDSSTRREEILHISYSKRYVPYFDRPMVLDLKGEYQYNFFNSDNLIVLKPSLNYFFLKKALPNYSLHITSPVHFPLNFEKNAIHRLGYYISGMYHYSSSVQLGITYEFYSDTWTDSKETKEETPSDSYEVTNSVNTTKVELIIHF